ncbi:MAG: HAD family hydrolase [Nocardioidaceae bacterium]
MGIAAFFDLDKTILAKSSTLAFSRPFYAGGLINRRSVLRSAYAQFVFALQGADHEQMEKMRLYLSSLCAGWPVQSVRDIVAETLHTIVDPLVYDEAVQLIEDHQAAGHDIVIVSSSGVEVAAPIGQMLGADHVLATSMVVEDGRYTGDIAFYAYGANKALAIRELAEASGYDLADCYAYSDSETDVAMLETVGHPFAVNPDKTLRRIATERHWPVLQFNRPVDLHERTGIDSARNRVAAVAAAAGFVSAGFVSWHLRRRRVGG